MKISELQSMVMHNCPETEQIATCHPKQIISDEITIPIWLIKYSYTTARGNKKTATKYIFLNESDWDLIDSEFHSYIEKMNSKHPERKLSNVEILDCEFLGKCIIPLD